MRAKKEVDCKYIRDMLTACTFTYRNGHVHSLRSDLFWAGARANTGHGSTFHK